MSSLVLLPQTEVLKRDGVSKFLSRPYRRYGTAFLPNILDIGGLFRRKRVIGGILLVFLVQLFVRTALSLFDIASVLVALRMRDRSVPVDERLLNRALLILVLIFAANAVTATAATVLLRTCNWHHIAYVRTGLGASAALEAATLLQRVSITNLLDAIFPLIFLPYFFLSSRVQNAFRSPEGPPLEKSSTADT